MPKRSSKRPRDVNRLATEIVRDATTEAQEASEPTEDGHDLSSYAKALGRRGGLKGGKARAQKLSAKRRSEIAKRAAKARWSDRKKG